MYNHMGNMVVPLDPNDALRVTDRVHRVENENVKWAQAKQKRKNESGESSTSNQPH